MRDHVFYVYLHRRKDTNEIFYVGKGRGDRAASVTGRSYGWYRVACEVGRSVEFFRVMLGEDQALKLERELIASLRASGTPLVNVTAGTTKKVKRKTIPSIYGSMRRRGMPIKGQWYYTWRQLQGNVTELATAEFMERVHGCDRKEVEDVLDGVILATSEGWCIYKPRGKRK